MFRIFPAGAGNTLNMHGTNGIDFLEVLIQKGCRQRHIALMSGNFSDTDLARAAKIGCALFAKPLELDAITAWVEVVEKSIPSERVLYNWVQTG